MGLVRILALRALGLVGVLLAVLFLVLIVLGATGVSDRLLDAIIREEIRGVRETLALTIHDPDKLEAAVKVRHQELVHLYGVDRPWFWRLPDTAWRVVTLDLGEARAVRSFRGSARVADIVLERVPLSVALLLTATVITALLGLALGVYLATRPGSRLDRVICFFSAGSYALPAWWTAILLILVFGFYLRFFPTGGMFSTPPPEGGLSRLLDLLWHTALPTLAMVLAGVGAWIYVVRTMVLNTAQEFFVTVGRAKGLPEGQVMRRYILRAAAPPIVTNLVFAFIGVLGGAILIETVFRWPGMGRLYYEAILAADENVIVALTFIFTLLYIAARFLLEVLYVILDPRVRYT